MFGNNKLKQKIKELEKENRFLISLYNREKTLKELILEDNELSKKNKLKITIETLEKLYENYNTPFYCDIHNKKDECNSCPENEECYNRFCISDAVEYEDNINELKELYKNTERINEIL